MTEIGPTLGFGAAPSVSGGVAYFGGQSAGNGNGLWRSDGTTAGTQFLSTVDDGNQKVIPCCASSRAQGRVYMAYLSPGGQYDLFAGDGTTAPPVALGTFDQSERSRPT